MSMLYYIYKEALKWKILTNAIMSGLNSALLCERLWLTIINTVAKSQRPNEIRAPLC